MHLKITLFTILFLLSNIESNSQSLDYLKTNIFPDDGPPPIDTNGFSFTDNYIPSNSYWASPFTEDYVYHARLKYNHPTNIDKSYELRLGKGGQIYSFLTSSGETVPPQYPATAPWVDEVWQMVAVDGVLNKPNEGKKHFIHQAGVYLKTDDQTLPFYSPIVAEYYNSSDRSYTVVNWGQQAHTSDNLNSGYTSSILYYARYKNLGEGLIQVDLLMYNFGTDVINFINIPWGGVRRSTYDHWFSSNTDHTYQEENGTFTSYSKAFNQTGGWAAFSSDALGSTPTFALLMDNDEGTLRMGDAGTIANRDYTVFEGIKFPGTDLGPGKSIRARNFYLLDSDINNIRDTIINQNLENKTFYGTHNKTISEVDSSAFSFEYQGNELVVSEVPYANGLQLKLRPYQNSQPLFLIKSTKEEYRVTTDLYTYSDYPYDGQLESIQLLGYRDAPTQVDVTHSIICSGEDYTFPDGTISSNITSTSYQISDVGTASNGYDSLIFTTVYIMPTDLPTVTFVNDGPGGVGSTNGGTKLALWLDATHLLGGTINNPVNGTPVDNWIDLSGNNSHYNSSGNNRPSFSNTNFNAVRFNAAAANSQFLTGTKEENFPYGHVFMALNATDAGNNNPLLSNANFSIKYEQQTNSGFLGFTDFGNMDYTSTVPSTFGINNIVSFQTDCATNILQINSGNNTDNLNIGTTTNGIPLGQLGTATEPVSGDFYEIIAFQSNINSAQKILIDNYLSAKYDNTLISIDLYDEDNSLHGNFDYHVAGIGRVDINNIHDNAKGSGIIEIKNPTNLEDGEFLIWGDNGQAIAFTDSTNLPNFVIAKSEINWRISEVNTSLSVVDVGLVDVIFDLSGVAINSLKNIVLLIDSNDDGNFGDETFIQSTTIENTDYEGQAFVNFNALNLQDGNRFCLAYLAPDAPGGVYTNLALWLAADGEVSTDGNQVTNWLDKSEKAKIVSGGLGPTFSTAADKLLNYNPVMTLDGVNDQFQAASIAGSDTHTDLNFFIVHRINAAPHQSTILREDVNGGGISSHLPWVNGRVFWDAGLSSGDGRIHTPSGLSTGNNALWQLSSHDGTTDLQFIRKNGKTLTSDNTAISIVGNSSSFYIGSTGSGLYSNADIAEVIAFIGNEELQNNQRAKIESYLALKYGYTLDNSDNGITGDYTNSNNITTWDADDNPTYHHGIIGLSRDDVSDLYQKQSNTGDDSVAVYIGNLSLYNGQNTASINTDLSSIIFGHNQGVLDDPTLGNTTEKPTGIYSRLQREWKVTNTNFIDDFAIKIACTYCGNIDINDIRLLVDDDGDFTNAQIYGTPSFTIAQGSLIISGIDVSMISTNSTQYFTIGSVNPTVALLPIELISFTATVINSTVNLDWKTANEINNDYFTIERSIKGIEWESIATIDGAGNSIEINTYHEIDKNPYSGKSYYRLKQTDFDGEFSYAAIRVVNLETNPKPIRIYPNPTTAQVTVEGNQEELKALQIFNILGQNVTNRSIITKEADKLNVDLRQLPDGIYIIKAKGNSVKIIKE